MSKQITFVVQKDKKTTICNIPFKTLSMKQRKHMLHYALAIIEKQCN